MQAPVVKLTGRVSIFCKRNIGVFAPSLQKATDPIQQLFLDKLRDYKSKSSGGKLVEPSPEMEKELQSNKDRVIRQFGSQPGEDLIKFPTFNFQEPEIETPGLEQTNFQEPKQEDPAVDKKK